MLVGLDRGGAVGLVSVVIVARGAVPPPSRGLRPGRCRGDRSLGFPGCRLQEGGGFGDVGEIPSGARSAADRVSPS
jgi:hypothetical protein